MCQDLLLVFVFVMCWEDESKNVLSTRQGNVT